MTTTIRIEPDGTRVFRYRGKICRTAPSTAPSQPRPTSYYSPFCGRQAFLAGRKDHRNTIMFAEIVRDRRQRVGCFRAVKPGPQLATFYLTINQLRKNRVEHAYNYGLCGEADD